MTTAAGAQQRPDIKFFAMIDDARAQRLGNAFDCFIRRNPIVGLPFPVDLERRRV